MMYPTNAQYMAMAQLASPTQMLLMCLPLLLAGAMLIIMVIVGFRAQQNVYAPLHPHGAGGEGRRE